MNKGERRTWTRLRIWGAAISLLAPSCVYLPDDRPYPVGSDVQPDGGTDAPGRVDPGDSATKISSANASLDATLCSSNVDQGVDPSNCGDSGVICPDGQVCSAGTCGAQCIGGTTQCGSRCVDTNSDPANCGTCGTACPAGQVCASGACAVQCGPGTTLCNGRCIDFTVDPANCGTCGHPCPAGQVCSAGACNLDCTGGTTKCGSRCVDTNSDPANCSTCGTACPAGQVCASGKCAVQCGPGTTLCNGRCVDFTVDPTNCGACGHVCAASEYCTGSQCTPTTGPPPRTCEGIFQYTLNTQDPYSTSGQPLPTCQLQADGSATMAFTVATAGDWIACDFAAAANLDSFDADNGHDGAMEIEFCVDKAMVGPLNLWYGAYPNRKKLELLLTGQAMNPGCTTVYFAPEDAVCHWSVPGWAGDCTGQPCAACGGLCNNSCPISFSNAKLTLIAEQCPQPITQTVTVQLKAVRFIPATCTCTRDNDCSTSQDRTHCDTGLFQSAICPAGASSCGLCVPPETDCPFRGQNCAVTLTDRTCPGVIVCLGTKSTCTVSDATCLNR